VSWCTRCQLCANVEQQAAQIREPCPAVAQARCTAWATRRSSACRAWCASRWASTARPQSCWPSGCCARARTACWSRPTCCWTRTAAPRSGAGRALPGSRAHWCQAGARPVPGRCQASVPLAHPAVAWAAPARWRPQIDANRRLRARLGQLACSCQARGPAHGMRPRAGPWAPRRVASS